MTFSGNMKRKNDKTMVLFAAASAAILAAWAGTAADPCSYVNHFIGTSYNGHCFPGACRPFGLVQASPDTGNGTWHYSGGYRYEDGEIWGFSQTHLNGTGRPGLGDMLVQPFAEADIAKAVAAKGCFNPIPAKFRKETEKAEPGYYAVTFESSGIRAEATATPRVALYRFTFNGDGPKRLFVDCNYTIAQVRNGKPVTAISQSAFAIDGRTGLSGRHFRNNWTENWIAFAVAFDRPFVRAEELPPKSSPERSPRYVFDFDIPKGGALMVKVALSGEGTVEDARRNMAAELPGWDFDRVRREAHDEWSALLSRCSAEGSHDQLVNFYTSLYHLFQQPNIISNAGEKPFYSTFSLWDTFRAAHPLYTIIAPERVPDFIDSMLEQGRRTGFLPIWCLGGFEGQNMIGSHSIPVIVDWYLKTEAAGRDAKGRAYWEDAYAQIKDTLTRTHEKRQKEQWDVLDRYGYYPFDIILHESASRTLECCYDDWCAAVLADRLGHPEDAAFFRKRAGYWRNVFDPETKHARGRDSKGAWRTPFDPFSNGRPSDFTEGNSMQYTFHVLHDVDGLAAAMGGREELVRRLDALFSAPEDRGQRVIDETGHVGQYAQGNEPSHHIAYLYTLAGRQDRAADVIRTIVDRHYLPKPDGLCGNDDCGQMSAWYVFAAMGFYPVNPCGGDYVLGAPQLPKVELRMKNRVFTVVARNLSKKNRRVKSVLLNGRPFKEPAIRHADIMAGGELTFEMCE